MKSTPPTADFTTSPSSWRSDRDSWPQVPERSTRSTALAEQAEGPIDPADEGATVVLPVPGLPTKTRCRVMAGRLQARLLALGLDLEQGDLPVISA